MSSLRKKVMCTLVSLAAMMFMSVMPAAAAAETVLAGGGESFYPVVIPEDASPDVEALGGELADYLEKISGAAFQVERGDGHSGIAVGSYTDFPELGFEGKFDSDDLMRRDEYIIRSHEDGLYLIGATDLAAQHAIWDLLHRLGHRQLIPTDTWEIVPRMEDIRVSVDDFESPDFINRRGPRGAPWSDAELWNRWQDRNRITSSFTLDTRHAYGGIISRNRQAFEDNPEYLALLGGKRSSPDRDSAKFCISNPDLRELVVQDAVNRVGPDTDSISMDPSDGSSWCECEQCAEMGSISDRVVILANEVAEAINDLGFDDEKYVGIYAYNQHSPPPSVDVHPNVIVSTATAFVRGGYTVDELIEGWSEKAERIGVRGYHAVHAWSQAMPRRARGGNIEYLSRRIPYFYEHGARFMNSESSDSWGSNALGYYFSGRILWDVDEAERAEEIVDDFVVKAFGDAYDPMRGFYRMIAEDYDTVRTNDDLLARMYGYLAEARELTDDPAVMSRLDELTLYTRYVELRFKFGDARGDEARMEAALNLFRHAYRMRDTMMVHIQALYRGLRRAGIDVPDKANPGFLSHPLIWSSEGLEFEPWKSTEPFSKDEIAGFIAAGLENYEKLVMPFEPVSFSEDLVPAAERLNLPEVPTGSFGGADSFRGRWRMFTWFTPEARELKLEVTGGLLDRTDRGNVRFELYSPQEVTLEPVDTDGSVPPDKETYVIKLSSPHDGLHTLAWSDGHALTRIGFPEDHPMTIRSCMVHPKNLRNRQTLYFYVPKGTETVGGFATHEKTIIYDGDGNLMLGRGDVEGGEGYFNIPVPEGQDGKLWKLHDSYRTTMLMTVPPYLARNERGLLLPREVVEADSE